MCVEGGGVSTREGVVPLPAKHVPPSRCLAPHVRLLYSCCCCCCWVQQDFLFPPAAQVGSYLMEGLESFRQQCPVKVIVQPYVLGTHLL